MERLRPIDALDPTLANALLSVDPQTGQVSVLYRDGTAGDPLRVATLTDGAWAHQTVATGIQPMIGTDMDSGDDRTQPLWYSTYDGAASVAFSQGDGNVTYQGQVQNDVGVIVASVTTATGQSLTVSNDGAVSGQQIVIARDASGELVIYDGTQQTDYGSDVVNIIVDAINGASLTVGESHGDVTPYGHVTLNGDGSGNTLEVVTAASGTTPPAGTYGTMSYFTPSDMWVSGALIGLSNVSAVWVDGGNDNDYALIDQALPYAVNFNDGSGSNDLFVDLSSVSLVGWQGVSLSGPTGSTTLHVTGTGGDDIFLFGQTSLELGGEDVVTYPGGDINRLLIDGGSGDDSLEVNAPLSTAAGAASFGGSSGDKSVDIRTPGGGLPAISGGSRSLTINAAGDFDLPELVGGLQPFDLTVNAGASVTLSGEFEIALNPLTLNINNGAVTFVAGSGSVTTFVVFTLNVPAGGTATVTSAPSLDQSTPARLIEVQNATINGTLTLNAPGGITFDHPTVIGRHVFYNNCYYDGNDTTANEADDNAIAPDKVALMPGQTATFANYTSYSKGINGIMIDVADLPNHGANLSLSAFNFLVGNSNDPSTWVAPTATATITVRPGKGAGGSDRIEITFPDGAINEEWLQVTLKATANTGLAAADVFYFGDEMGETGNSTSNTFVDGSDFAGARDNPANFLNRAPLTDPYDFNRDSFVDGADLAIARDDTTNFLTDLELITPPTA